jgi:hypothetical protein
LKEYEVLLPRKILFILLVANLLRTTANKPSEVPPDTPQAEMPEESSASSGLRAFGFFPPKSNLSENRNPDKELDSNLLLTPLFDLCHDGAC